MGNLAAIQKNKMMIEVDAYLIFGLLSLNIIVMYIFNFINALRSLSC